MNSSGVRIGDDKYDDSQGKITQIPTAWNNIHNIKTTGSGGGGGDMDSRIAKLESDVGHINSTLTDFKQDFRDFTRENKISALKIHLWGAVIVVLGGIATAYIAMDDKVTTLFEGQNSINLELGKLAGSLDHKETTEQFAKPIKESSANSSE